MMDLATYVDSRRLAGRHGYKALDWQCRSLVGDRGFRGSDVLEVGVGEGLVSLWFLHQGARRVVSLEPEADGSTEGSCARARGHRERLAIAEERWQIRAERFQDFSADRRFRLIAAHCSINHLDEEACVHLGDEPGARERYVQLFERVRELLHPGGAFVFSDCGRHNYWNRLGRASPWSPEIEWHKHQEPGTWCGLLESVGFSTVRVKWILPFYPLRALEPLMTPFAARCLTSTFVVQVEKR